MGGFWEGGLSFQEPQKGQGRGAGLSLSLCLPRSEQHAGKIRRERALVRMSAFLALQASDCESLGKFLTFFTRKKGITTPQQRSE